MKCPKCGAATPDGSNFCRGCGTALNQLGGDIEEGQNKSVTGTILYYVILFAVIALGSFLINHFI